MSKLLDLFDIKISEEELADQEGQGGLDHELIAMQKKKKWSALSYYIARAVEKGGNGKKGVRYSLRQLLDCIDDSSEAVAFVVDTLFARAHLNEARFIYAKYKEQL